MTLAAVNLDDKYTLESGRIYLTGTQALVRLPLMQRQRDTAAGLHTGCFISGYRGSPLGQFDMELWKARRFLERNHIRLQPGVNEDLAATAVWGSQQVKLLGQSDFDGVFGIWYGKGPGVDRTGDAFRHANLAGTAPHGGVLALLGDDHMAKSSTTAHQSEYAMVDAMIPVLNPAGVQEFLDFGLYGWAMSRFAGCWVGFKCVTQTVDSSASVIVDPHRIDIVVPEDFAMPPGGLHIRWPEDFLAQEERLHRYKIPAVREFARLNKLDRIVFDSPKARLGIITAGKSYLDVRQALADLGIDEKKAADLGIRLYKPTMTWPLEPEGLRRFAQGLEEILVVEEKRPLIEDQVKELLFNEQTRPARVIGKKDETGEMLLPSNGELMPDGIAFVIADRIGRFHRDESIADRVAYLRRKGLFVAEVKPSDVKRTPYFCAGCPHNTSTRLPDGSIGMAGIGCHWMALNMNRNTYTYTHMGGEGANWAGAAPFSKRKHMFQNVGDGTYFHSGFLAIRSAVAAGVNITYKILYNDAVAMTGGQAHDGGLTVPEIARQVEGLAVQHSVLGGNLFLGSLVAGVGQILGGAETRQAVGILEGDARGCPADGLLAGLLALKAVVGDLGLGLDRQEFFFHNGSGGPGSNSSQAAPGDWNILLVLDYKIAGVGGDDAVFAGESGNFLLQFLLFATQANFIQKVSHSAGCPDARDEGVSFLLLGKNGLVFEGSFFATDGTFESDLTLFVAWLVAAEHDHLVPFEEVGQVLRVDSKDPVRTINRKLEIGQNGFGNLGVKARHLVLEVFLG